MKNASDIFNDLPDASEFTGDTQEPAFPYCPSQPNGLNQSGMTLWDYFAAKAMQAMLTQDAKKHNWSNAKVAEFAYDAADAMMEERNSTDR